MQKITRPLFDERRNENAGEAEFKTYEPQRVAVLQIRDDVDGVE